MPGSPSDSASTFSRSLSCGAAKDVEDLKVVVAESEGRAAIIAKIERPEALEDIDAILDAADGIMVARGDLGVEMPPQKVPLIQIQLTDRARSKAKPVIVATQMLESMVEKPRPTRAEVSDVALAVRSGADAVMLSAESAVGKYPVAAVEMMDTVARETEAYLWHVGGFRVLSQTQDAPGPLPVEDSLAKAMAQLSRDIRARAIVVISKSGRTAQVMSASRPGAPNRRDLTRLRDLQEDRRSLGHHSSLGGRAGIRATGGSRRGALPVSSGSARRDRTCSWSAESVAIRVLPS